MNGFCRRRQTYPRPKPWPLSPNPAEDYSKGASHVLTVNHQILNHHRQLEQKWSKKKVKLHQKLALRLFQDDVKQVLDWLENHGEVFLRKNVGIGRNLAKAKAHQRSHQHFECVAQVNDTVSGLGRFCNQRFRLGRTWQSLSRRIESDVRQLFWFLVGHRTRTPTPRSCWRPPRNWPRPASAAPTKFTPSLDSSSSTSSSRPFTQFSSVFCMFLVKPSKTQ